MNMSYCRFRNTLNDLQDCFDNWDDDEEGLSPEEKRAREKLLELCQEICDQYGDE